MDITQLFLLFTHIHKETMFAVVPNQPQLISNKNTVIRPSDTPQFFTHKISWIKYHLVQYEMTV